MVISEPRRDPENAERSFLQRYASHAEGRVLDIGCVDGRLTWFYARDAGFVVGSDIKMEKLRSARIAQPEAISAKVCFAASRGETIPFANETFNLAIFSWSL